MRMPLEQPAIVEDCNRLEQVEELHIYSLELSFDKDGIARMAVPPGFGPSFEPTAEDMNPILPETFRGRKISPQPDRAGVR